MQHPQNDIHSTSHSTSHSTPHSTPNSDPPIFPPINPLPKILNPAALREGILEELQSDPDAWNTYQRLAPQDQETFLAFCTGSRGLKATYDPFFKHLFSPERHPERLNSLLSALLGQEAVVLASLPLERSRLSENSALAIMDLLVRLADGSLVNVEMQRKGYLFPIERSFCYASDLLMRQYDLNKEALGKDFSYQNMKPVYVIVLMEKSSSLFAAQPDKYIHRSQFLFDTGLEMHSLQIFFFISLDIFRKIYHNKNEMTDLEAWLYFFSSDDSTDILSLVQRDIRMGQHLFQELYNDIARFRYKPKELINMFSEALSILDRNTIALEAELAKQENERLKQELHSKDEELLSKDEELLSKDEELFRMKQDNELLLAKLAEQEKSSFFHTLFRRKSPK